MYPYADVPVLQLSMPTHDPDRLLELGRRLRPLREEGVLVIGSGFMTHGLPFLTMENFATGHGAGLVLRLRRVGSRGAGERRRRHARRLPDQGARHAVRAPTVEHFTPLFITLGAASEPDGPVQTTIDGFAFGLAKRSFQVA